MTELTRDERVDRQQRDDGDPDDPVAVASPAVYHDDPECGYLSDEVRLISRAQAQREWLAPCMRCVLQEVGPDA